MSKQQRVQSIHDIPSNLLSMRDKAKLLARVERGESLYATKINGVWYLYAPMSPMIKLG